MARIKIELGHDSVQNAITKLQNLKKDLGKLQEEIPKELAKQTSDKIKKFYMSSSTTGESPGFGVTQKGTMFSAYITGPSVTYEEFGTGDVGAKNPHPNKGEYGLRPYNSGPTIRSTEKLTPEYQAEKGLENGLYWTYKKNGEKVYTQGIPAGRFMYNASIWLKDNHKKIVKQKVDDVLSKL